MHAYCLVMTTTTNLMFLTSQANLAEQGAYTTTIYKIRLLSHHDNKSHLSVHNLTLILIHPVKPKQSQQQ